MGMRSMVISSSCSGVLTFPLSNTLIVSKNSSLPSIVKVQAQATGLDLTRVKSALAEKSGKMHALETEEVRWCVRPLLGGGLLLVCHLGSWMCQRHSWSLCAGFRV